MFKRKTSLKQGNVNMADLSDNRLEDLANLNDSLMRFNMIVLKTRNFVTNFVAYLHDVCRLNKSFKNSYV